MSMINSPLCSINIGGSKNQVIQQEIEKILSTGFIREIRYLTWLNIVVVLLKKKWKMENG